MNKSMTGNCLFILGIIFLRLFYSILSRKKLNYVRSRLSHFFLRTFGEVEGHLGPNEASDETYKEMFRSSRSNETMQNVLASTVIF